MGLHKSSIKHWARTHVSSSIYKYLSEKRRNIFIPRLKTSGLYMIEKMLPSNFCIQGMRSLELQGISDEILEAVIQDYLDFVYKHMRTVLDAIRVVSLIEAVMKSNELIEDIAECGVFQGASSKIICHFADPAKKLHLFDTFTGFDIDDRSKELKQGTMRDPGERFTNTYIELVKKRIFSGINGRKSQLNEEGVIFHAGPVQDTLETVNDIRFSLVHLDMDLYEPTRFALEFFIPRMSTNGILLLHDYAVNNSGYRGVYKATKDVNLSNLCGPLPFGDWSTALFVKSKQ
jgi:hypothetical protein